MAAVASYSRGLSSLSSDDVRIEFDEDVLPPPMSRLQEPAPEEDYEARLQRTQEELLQLRHQARLVERRKEELEEISRKERELARGRVELHEKINRALVTLERESVETRRRLEELLQARQDLGHHSREVAALRQEPAAGENVQAFLDEGLEVITAARLDYERVAVLLEPPVRAAGAAASPAPRPSGGALLPVGFRYWLRAGFAFTLPMILLGVAALIIHKLW